MPKIRKAWNKGLKMESPSKETRHKLSKALRGNTNGFYKGMMPWNKGKRMPNVNWRKGLSSLEDDRIISGERHYNWKGGVSRDKHNTVSLKYRKWRISVFKRDNYICQECGIKSGYGKTVVLEAHHIKSWAKYKEKRFDIENGLTLCVDCHKLTDNYKGKNNGLIQTDNGDKEAVETEEED